MKKNITLDQKINKACINDAAIQQLQAEKVKIASLEIPKILVSGSGAEMIWMKKANQPIIDKIDELINYRMSQLNESYRHADRQRRIYNEKK